MAVSEKDKARWRAIGKAMDELNEEALEADAQRSPGENLNRGLRLSDDAAKLATQWGAVREEKVKVPLIVLWRALKARRG